MCKSCDETADGQGRRCRQHEGGFTPSEGAARTSTRALNAMATSLDAGDAATATRAATRAADARERLDLMADPDAAPVFQLFVHPSAVPAVEKALQDYKAEYPDALVDYRLDTHYKVPENDISVGQMWTNVIIRDRQLQNFAQRVRFPADVRTDGTPVLSTYHVLASAISHNEQHGGFIKKGEPNSAAEAITAKFRLPFDDRETLVPTSPNSISHCIQAREYLQTMTPTSDFEKRVQAVANHEFIEEKDIALLAAGANIYWRRQRAAEDAAKRAAEQPRPDLPPATATLSRGAEATRVPLKQDSAGRSSQQAGPSRTAAKQGSWLGSVGDDLVVRGRVTRVQVIDYRSAPRDMSWDRRMIIMETDSGDRVRCFVESDEVREGDYGAVRGFVSGHGWFNGSKQTEINDGHLAIY